MKSTLKQILHCETDTAFAYKKNKLTWNVTGRWTGIYKINWLQLLWNYKAFRL